MNGLVKLLVLAVLVWQAPKFCHRWTDGFSILNISSNLPYEAKWEISEPEQKPFNSIFSQKFTYLNSGGQSYVFASDDGAYVLKFFKHYRMRLHPIVSVLPLPKRLDEKRTIQRLKRERKRLRDFTSYKLAYEKLPKETELLYVHLNKSSDLDLTVRIVDKLNIEHTLHLDNYAFVLQKRAELAYPYLRELVDKGDLKRAKDAVRSICELVIARSSKGIYDEDAKIHRNVGFIDNRAVLIDVGRLKVVEQIKNRDIQLADLKKITSPLLEYLQELSPELADYLLHVMENLA